AFRIGRDLVARSNYARWLDVAHNLERLAVDYENAITAADIEELLVRIRRQGQVASKRRAGSDELLQELSVLGKHLDAPVVPMGHIHVPDLGDPDGVHVAQFPKSGMRETGRVNHLAMVIVHRLVGDRAPELLV